MESVLSLQIKLKVPLTSSMPPPKKKRRGKRRGWMLITEKDDWHIRFTFENVEHDTPNQEAV